MTTQYEQISEINTNLIQVVGYLGTLKFPLRGTAEDTSPSEAVKHTVEKELPSYFLNSDGSYKENLNQFDMTQVYSTVSEIIEEYGGELPNSYEEFGNVLKSELDNLRLACLQDQSGDLERAVTFIEKLVPFFQMRCTGEMRVIYEPAPLHY